jgi:catechol 2,3-dioxygenase-like lactoylglutathione lyase family enzyme
VIPILRVARLEASVGYYVERLGFRVDWQEPGVMASVSRDGHAIMLCEGAQGHPGTWVWIGVHDAEALHAELLARGALVRTPPTNHPWALETQAADPDGHVLRFGSGPRTDRPFERP